MRRIPYVFRLRSTSALQYRIRVPQDLVTRIGRRELKRSLRTADPMVARERALVVGHAAHCLFHAIRQDPLLGPNDIAELTRAFYALRLEEDLQARAHASATGLTLPVDRTNLVEARRRQLAGCDFNAIQGSADAFLATRGITLEPGGRDDLVVRLHLLRAELEATRRMLERDQGVYFGEPEDPLLKGTDPFWGTATLAMPAQGQSPLATTVAALVDDFDYGRNAELSVTAYAELVIDEKGFEKERIDPVFDPESNKMITAKSHAQKYRAAARTLAEIIGDKRVRDVKATELVHYKDEMRKAPKHYSQARLKTVAAAIAWNETQRPKRPTLAAKTINDGYLSPLRQIFQHAQKNLCIRTDPTKGVSVVESQGSRTKAHEKRDPFEIGDLNRILGAPLFTGAQSDYYWHNPGSYCDRSYRFWTVLAMLYMGIRPEELAQLVVNDLDDDDGYPCLKITTRMSEADRREERLLLGAARSKRQLKTGAAERNIPIHPVLIAFGFLELFAKAREAGHLRLFPDWKRACDGRYSNLISKEFNAPNRFLDRVGVKSETKVLYSFRHNFRDGLKGTDLDRGEEQLLLGHESGEVTDIYGSRKMYARLINRFITTFRYEGLDLMQIRDADGSPALKPERVPDAVRARLERLGCNLDVALDLCGLGSANEERSAA